MDDLKEGRPPPITLPPRRLLEQREPPHPLIRISTNIAFISQQAPRVAVLPYCNEGCWDNEAGEGADYSHRAEHTGEREER